MELQSPRVAGKMEGENRAVSISGLDANTLLYRDIKAANGIAWDESRPTFYNPSSFIVLLEFYSGGQFRENKLEYPMIFLNMQAHIEASVFFDYPESWKPVKKGVSFSSISYIPFSLLKQGI